MILSHPAHSGKGGNTALNPFGSSRFHDTDGTHVCRCQQMPRLLWGVFFPSLVPVSLRKIRLQTCRLLLLGASKCGSTAYVSYALCISINFFRKKALARCNDERCVRKEETSQGYIVGALAMTFLSTPRFILPS